MKLVALFLLLAPTLAPAAGGDRDPGASIPQTDIRREILAPYRFVQHQEHPAPPAPIFLAREPTPPESQDLFRLPPSDIRGPHVMNRLDEAVLRERAGARAAMVASRLGIGVESVRVARRLAIGAATAFYVPVAVGIGVVW